MSYPPDYDLLRTNASETTEYLEATKLDIFLYNRRFDFI